MQKPSQYINDICSECHPQTYDLTLAKFVGEENTVEVVGNPDYSFAEFLYECCGCGTKVWVDDQWVKCNSVALKTIEQRNEYINKKSAQLDKITDAHEYMHRLSRIMLYHKLLTELEVAVVKQTLEGGKEYVSRRSCN